MADAIVGDFWHQNLTENITLIELTLFNFCYMYNYSNDKVIMHKNN